MLTVSLHGIRIIAPHGLYPQENILGNHFEVDVDVNVPTQENTEWPFVDYVRLRAIVHDAFQQPGQFLEGFVKIIHGAIKQEFIDAGKVRVVVRKMNPPMQGHVQYSQVAYEA
jgi:dihydroneopterin aldolase